MGVNREHSDSFFRAVFKEPENALKLYGDLNDRIFDKNTIVEMKPLETVFLSKLRNDLSFLIDGKLIVIVEAQKTPNWNMPLRSLQYVLLFYETYCNLGKALYQEKLIKLPKPEFYTLYNGKKPWPVHKVMRLSDAFIGLEKGEIPGMEVIVNVINIRYGSGAPVLERNEKLRGCAILESRIRQFQEAGMSKRDSIRKAVEKCKAEGILVEELEKYKGEIEAMFSLVYDEEEALQTRWEEGRDEGEKRKAFAIAREMLLDGEPVEKIMRYTGLTREEVEDLKKQLFQ